MHETVIAQTKGRTRGCFQTPGKMNIPSENFKNFSVQRLVLCLKKERFL